MRPVMQGAQAWHKDHAFADLCASCHGGDPTEPTEIAAHASLRAVLGDPASACGGCHTEDAQARAARYLATQASTGPTSPGSATPPSTESSNGQPPSAPPPNAQNPGAGASFVNRVLAALAAALGVALYVVLRRKLATKRRPLLAWLRAKTWSPYVAGLMLGLVVAVSEVGFGRPLAAAGAFDKLAAYPGRLLFPSSQYYKFIMTPGITWQVWVIVGVLGGAFASSKLSKEARLRWLPDTEWQPRFGTSRGLRLAIAFVGAILVQVGAAIAGGCTSGLAISGGAALAPAAFLFMAGMFAGGIPTAWLWHRKLDGHLRPAPASTTPISVGAGRMARGGAHEPRGSSIRRQRHAREG